MSDVEPTMQSGALSYVSLRAKAVQAVHSPLGFFVLALLIVETFLFGAGTWFGLTEQWKIAALMVGTFLFLVVFFTVVWLVVKYPKNLVFSEESYVAAMQIFGSEGQLITGRELDSLRQQATPNPPTGQLPGPGQTG